MRRTDCQSGLKSSVDRSRERVRCSFVSSGGNLDRCSQRAHTSMSSLPFRLAIPFAGIDGVGEACRDAGWAHTLTNVIESNANLTPYLSVATGIDVLPKDITLTQPSEFEDADIAFFGFPCQPHTKLGTRNCCADPRMEPLWAALRMCQELHKRRSLKAVIMENSPGFMEGKKGKQSWFDLQQKWALMMPDWLPLGVWKIDARDVIPMSRLRVFIISFPRAFKAVLDFGRAPTRDTIPISAPIVVGPKPTINKHLLESSDEIDVSNLGPKMQGNLKLWLTHLPTHASAHRGC